ncbi:MULTISPECIES: TetR/AcrR family transcriptional regulator [unclassified Crossiella]|uniref:TetR/AcrR family transcriptional regulator n=1 Tax=unclassified Crossiella TaxID=2620835 RepID=UPI001FFF0364|nr:MULTISPECIES: TetR/AcrR family transcriptional regulator [unclassified Crossiella]MCK2238847.1 TetR/AcrR family transcriptional regulator [Crossiella sp. S99.2]MCK2251583.1 TetR/AcrR family transcriptional regulator [Crossiella sp. S99.1]
MPAKRVPEHRTRRRRTHSGQLLSPELIVDTALRLIELHGPDGLSLRRLGAALGADATAVYRYFTGKHDLLLAITDELIGRTFTGYTRTGDCVTDLRALGIRIYEANRAHPRAAALVTARITGREHEIAAVETILGVLRGAGFDPATAVRHYRCFIGIALSFAALDSAVHTTDPGQAEVEAATWREVYDTLPAQRYPNITASAAELVAQMPETPFYLTLELFLSTLATAAPGPGGSASCHSPRPR